MSANGPIKAIFALACRGRTGVSVGGFVLQQDEGLFGGFADERAMFGDGGVADLGAGRVGVVEEAEGEFYAEDVADSVVDGGHGDAPGLDEGGQLGIVCMRPHVDFDSGGDGLFGSCGAVECDAVVDEFADCVVVADDEAVETPLLAEDGVEQVGVGGGGDSVEGVEGAWRGLRLPLLRQLCRAGGGPGGAGSHSCPSCCTRARLRPLRRLRSA